MPDPAPPSQQNKVRVAQIGCNGVAHAHARTHQWTGNTELVAVCDLDADKARAFAESYGVRQWFASADDLLALPEVDMVDIVTPDHTHACLALQAINSGRHVLIEKPFATSLDAADAVIAAVEVRGVKAMSVQSMRWQPKLRTLAEQVHNGVIGKPVFARIWGGCPPFWSSEQWPKAASGGRPEYLLIHNGMHSMDLLTWLMNDRVASVYTIGHPGQPDVPLWEYFSVNVGFASGSIGLFEENRIVQPAGYPTPGVGVHVVGEDGTLVLEPTAGTSVSIFNREGTHLPGAHLSILPDEDGFTGMMSEMARAILDDAPPPIPLADSRAVLASVLAAAASTRSGQPVEVAHA